MPYCCGPQGNCRCCHEGESISYVEIHKWTVPLKNQNKMFAFQVMVANKNADIAPENLVVRFSEAVDGFPLPKGHSQNPELQAPQKPEAEAFLKDR